MANFKERAKQRSKQLALGDKFKLHQEDNYLRILPTPESKPKADDEVFAEILMHSNVGPDPKNARYLRCGHDPHDKNVGDCYLCDVYIPRLIERGHTDTANDLKPKWTLCLQVLSLDEDTQKYSGPFFYMVGGKLGRAVLTTLSTGKRDITHPEKGYTFCINRQGEALKTTYSGPFLDEDPTEIPQKYVDMLKPFSKLQEMPQYSEQAQKDAIKGEKSDSRSAPKRRGVLDDDEDEDERPRRKRSVDDEDEPAPKSKRRAAVEDDEDDESEDEPVAKPKRKRGEPADDDDEDETPARKSKSKPAVEDDEDEPAPKPAKRKAAVAEDEDDEDEDERPAPRVSKRHPADDEDEDERPRRREIVEDDEDEDEPPARKSGKTITVNKRKPVDDEDEPAPTRKSAPAKKSRVVDEDDEDEDEAPAPKAASKKRAVVEPEDDEDEEPPAKSSKKMAVKADKKKPVDDDDDDDPFADD